MDRRILAALVAAFLALLPAGAPAKTEYDANKVKIEALDDDLESSWVKGAFSEIPSTTFAGLGAAPCLASPGRTCRLTDSESCTALDALETGDAPAVCIYTLVDGTPQWRVFGGGGAGGGALTDGNKVDVTVSDAGATWQLNAGSVGAPELVNTTTGATCGSATTSCVPTYDNDGRITGKSEPTITPSAASVTLPTAVQGLSNAQAALEQLGKDQRIAIVSAGQTLAKGDPVAVNYESGAEGGAAGEPHVWKAEAQYPAAGFLYNQSLLGVSLAAYTAGQNAQVVTRGYLDALNTSAYEAGDFLCVGQTGGLAACTSTALSHRMCVAQVVRKHASTGKIWVMPPGCEKLATNRVRYETNCQAPSGTMRRGDLCVLQNTGAPHIDRTSLWLCTAASCSDSSTILRVRPSLGTQPGREILVVGDSYAMGNLFDEAAFAPGAFPNGLRGRLAGRLTAQSSMRVGYLFATTTGEMFGSGSDTDVLEYVDTRPGVTDVVLLIGTNDCVVGCSHGSGGSFNPSSAAVGACNFAQTLANLSYVIAGLEARSIRAWHVTSPGLMGVYAGFGGTYASCVEALVETGGTTTDGLTAELNATQCVGADFCESTNAAYAEACAGSGTTYPDPGGVACGTSNLINYGDGAGKVNRDNSKVYMAEDQVLSQRGGWIPYLHLSGIGHHAIFRTIVNWMKTSTGVSGNGSLDDAEFYGPLFVQDFANRPAVPTFTYANLTSTSVEITPSIGTYVNGADGTLGYCTGDGADCYAVCSAQCVDDDKTSTDPACATGAESAVARNLGTPDGGTHRVGEIANKRGTAVIPFGYTGKLIGLHAATEYALQCYAVSLNGVSHPYVQLVTTP